MVSFSFHFSNINYVSFKRYGQFFIFRNLFRLFRNIQAEYSDYSCFLFLTKKEPIIPNIRPRITIIRFYIFRKITADYFDYSEYFRISCILIFEYSEIFRIFGIIGSYFVKIKKMNNRNPRPNIR